MPSVCLDAFNIALPKGSGIATYGRNLIQDLGAVGIEAQLLYGPHGPIGDSRLLDTVALTDAPAPKGRPAKIRRWAQTLGGRFGRTAHPVTLSEEVIWAEAGGGRPPVERFWAARSLFELGYRAHRAYGTFTPVSFPSGPTRPDAAHWTCPMPLSARGMPNLYTFHDLIPLKLPHSTMDDKKAFLDMCREIARRADHMVAVSETTRQDVIKLLGVDEKRITTTYQSVNLPAQATERPDAEVQAYNEGVFDLGWKDYFLYYGAIEPKKNVGRLVEAYLASGVSTPLVIVGGRSWLDGGETALIHSVVNGANALRKGRIRQHEFLSSAMLHSLVRGAKATLFPSLYEGFGLPVLESMQMGTAVLTSTGGSLPEVAGDAALVVAPDDVEAIKRGIIALDADDALRADLEARGRIQARRFTPAAHQERLAAVYAGLGLR
ncbi:glycosyltransferase family 1 protein [Brevundimonas pondensis]|uniref:Glycosyltransferase family 4 protein n=1 Tax=Brevundimonas pondensis TaxID=2774189 RepID=A0ABX7SJI5_9CAUL|nr:glycosyltransferase family 1 protein [Brevundimonas pondensis]QTC87306.1 glycosyltransferase family 4 protein [Brevundimonas pondensis]